jgi:hypothetical protein
MKTEIISYTLGTQFACYVWYGDLEGITDQERRLFDDLEQSSRIDAPDGYHFSHWAVQTTQYDEFTRCEATDLMGSCYQFDAVYFANEEQTA